MSSDGAVIGPLDGFAPGAAAAAAAATAAAAAAEAQAAGSGAEAREDVDLSRFFSPVEAGPGRYCLLVSRQMPFNSRAMRVDEVAASFPGRCRCYSPCHMCRLSEETSFLMHVDDVAGTICFGP